MGIEHGADVNAYTYEPAVFRIAGKLRFVTGEYGAGGD